MVYLLLVILVIANWLLAFGKKHSKIFTIIFICFLWILYWSNNNNPDYYNYMNTYSNIQYINLSDANQFGLEYGYFALQKIISFFNIDFTGFLMIISATGLMLIYSTISKFTKNTNYVILLYFLMPFFLDVVQVRNFLSMAIMIFSVRYLIENNKRSKIKFIIGILLAATFHIVAFVYLPIVFIGNSNKKMFIKFIVIISILSSIVILVGINFIPIISNLIYKVINSENIKSWFEIRTRYGYILFFGMQLMNFLMISIAKRNAIKNRTNISDFQNSSASKIYENSSYIFIELVYWINVFAFAFFPLYILASTFTRLMRNLLLLNYIAFSATSESFKGVNNDKLLFNVEVVIYGLIWFLIELYIPYKDSVLNIILQNSSFFK